MSWMSLRRLTTLKFSAVASSPSTKRDSFHWPKYSPIVGTITTSAVNASLSAAASRGRRLQLARVQVEVAGGGDQERGVGQDLAERQSCRRRPGRARLRLVAREGAPEHALRDVVEGAGLLDRRAVRELQVERDRALGVVLHARPRRR